MRETRIQIARPDIVTLFEQNSRAIFRYGDIAHILTANRGFWRLTQRMTTDEFLDYLLKSTKLRKYDFDFKRRKETRFVWEDVPFLEVIVNLHPSAYLSHYSAVWLHGLTEQVPKTMYLNVEQPQRGTNSSLTQRSVDSAFQRKPRISTNVAVFKDYRICQINGKFSNQLGVGDLSVHDLLSPSTAKVRVTGVERTLIDIAVRPFYAGGVHEVLKAYGIAKERDSSVNRLVAILKKLDFTYPYHQSIGFYMEKVGFESNLLDLLRRIPREFDFYLTHQIGEKVYVKEWRLWVPKGMEL
jgi:predicted transcriptional regulator of viral defense system